MLRRVRRYISTHIAPLTGAIAGQRVLVGVSGGADSIALLDVLQRCGVQCIVGHCNFSLRGGESVRDEEFVRAYAAAQGLPLRVATFDTAAYARQEKISIELAARELRYRWFEQVAREEGCIAVAVAHHQNDQAETLLMNLRRGTGLRGLGGMRPVSPNPVAAGGVPVIRPLLCTTRAYIRHYLRDIRHIGWVEDSSNNDTTYRRNAVRAETASYSEAEIEHMAQTAETMQGYADWLEKKNTRLEGICRLYEELREYGFHEIDKIYDAMQADEGGKTWESDTHRAVWRKHKLVIEEK